MRLISATLSKAGGRDTHDEAAGCLPPSADFGCWVLASGQGKRGGGDIGAQKVVRAILDACAAHPKVSGRVLEQAMDAAQQEIFALQAEIVRNQSIRVAAAALCSGKRGILWAHIGDARVYAFRGGDVVARTQDHSVAQMLVNVGELAPSELRGHAGCHRLLRSIGLPGAVQPSVLETPFAIQPGDLFLLCSGGFWHHLAELEMQAEWCKSQDLEDWLERMETRLLETAPADPGNYSAIALLAQD